MNTTFTNAQLEQANEAYINAYYEGIFEDPHGIMPLDKAEPIINAYVDMTVNEIEYRTGRRPNRWAILGDATDDYRVDAADDEEGNECIDLDMVWMLLEKIEQEYIEMYEEEKTPGIKRCPPAKMPK